jgi:hypothetical protein
MPTNLLQRLPLIKKLFCRSQLPRGLRHELSSLAQTLGSNHTWGMDIYVHLFCISVLSCVQVAALRWSDPSFKESYRLCIDQETNKVAKVQQRNVEP